MEGLSKKEKGLMDMDNSVVVVRGRGYRVMEKNTIKIKVQKINIFLIN